MKKESMRKKVMQAEINWLRFRVEDCRERVNHLDKRVERSQAAKENAVQQARVWAGEACTQQTTVHEIYQAIGYQGGDWNGARPVVEMVTGLAEALTVNTHQRVCPDCERFLVDGEPHDAQCKHARVMAVAERILAEQPSPTLDEVLDAVGFNPFKPLTEPLDQENEDQ